MSADLTKLAADAIGDNAARVKELVDLAAGMDDDFPVVLLPVRMETRFVTVDVPVDEPLRLGGLAELLGKASRLLGEIAARDLATVKRPTAKEHREFKAEVENPMAEQVALELREAEEALDAADVLMRSRLDGEPGEFDDVESAVAGIHAGLRGAAESLTRLRSDWQRERLSEQLAALAERAAPTLEAVKGRVLPATRLRAALEREAERPRPELARRPGLEPRLDERRLGIEPRLAVEPRVPRTAPVSSESLAAGAEAFEAVLAGVRRLADEPAAAVDLAGAATTIPLLPGAWKRGLTGAVEEARRSGAVLPADLDALEAAIAAIRSDDPRLDETVPRPEVVVTLPGATVVEDRLLVRIYPDDIAVDTHEEQLTAEEVDVGKAFWQETSGAGEPARQAAWRALCGGRGPRRAAWIVRRTKPPDPQPTGGAERAERILKALTVLQRRVEEVAGARPGERLDALIRAAEGLAEELSTRGAVPARAIDEMRERFATVRAAIERLDREAGRREAAEEEREWLRQLIERIESQIERLRVEEPPPPPEPDVGELKEGSWTRAARSGVLPERFLVVTVSGDDVAHAVAGAPVPADLKLSIDPDPDDPASEEFRLEDGELVVGESIRWMVEYDEALAKGMAVTIPITPQEAQQGFDFVYAIGLRGGDADEGAGQLEELLDNHHFGQTGLGLVPVGTPTNNSEADTSGFGSTDDPDEEFAIELGEPLVDEAAPLDADAGDGLRVARALGVEPATLAHVRGADGRDAADAQAMGAALYPATIGAALEEHAAPLMSRDARVRLRAFALGNVAARGLVPALRVGAQPYGLLPATAHSRFAAHAGDVEVPATERAAQTRFDGFLSEVLREMAEDWAKIRADHVQYATDPDVADPRAHFLALLGLEAVSSGASYRFAVNVAGRHSVASRDPELEFGLPPKPGEPETGARFGPYALLDRFQSILAEAFGVNAGAEVLVDGLVSDAYADVYEALQDSRAYELRLLKRSHLLHGDAVDPDPAVDLAALAAATPAQLAQQAASGDGDQPLLRLLARQALLLEWRDAAVRILLAEELVSEEAVIEAGASAHFIVRTLYEPTTLTRWSYLFEVMAELQRIQGVPFGGPLYAHLSNGQMSMADFLTSSGATSVAWYDGGRHVPELQVVQSHAAGLAALGTLPAARLEELMREHLDVASHRLDAWVTGLAQRRLTAMRADAPRGAHVGAYGWVENLQPDHDDDPATGVPAALDGDPSRPVYRADERHGFVQAPSVDHAVTAAILRSGYLSQRGEKDVENRMAVNLTSRRTRMALGLIEGVRAGNRLGALLGYRLERFLHDHHAAAGVTLDAVIGPMRAGFPSAAGVDAELNAGAAARQVCDGLAIVDKVTRWIDQNAAASAAGRTVYDILSDGGNFTGHPWGLGGAVPPTTDRDELDGVIRAIDSVADALDAVADLVVAEAVHQIALGNHERAAAVLSSLGEGKAPPRPEIVDTPRTGTPLTHRLLMPLPDPAGAPAGWEAIPLTARATAEPVLNAWAGGLLGDPADIRLRVVHADDGSPAGEVAMEDLGLQPLDLVAILGPGLETGLGEIASRALDSRRPAELDDAMPPRPLQVELASDPSWTGDVRPLVEVAPLLEAMSGLIGRARPANAQDYLLGESQSSAGDSGVDMVDLQGRVQAARTELTGAAVELFRLLAEDAALGEGDLPADPRGFLAAQDPVPDLPRWIMRDTWRDALLRAAAFGVPAGLPPERYETRVQVRLALRAAAETAFVELAERRARAAEALAGDATESALLAASRAVFGEDFTLLPRAEARNRAELGDALAAGLASPAAVEGWLEGAAAVRDSAAALSDVRVLADAGGAALPDAEVAQLPFVAGEHWLGSRLPSQAPREGRLSLVVLAPDALPAEGATGAGLMVDEWTETIPSAEETTGVAVYSDQPDASPPQCVLIAVPPQRRGVWQLGDMLQTLHDTLELAKSRAVELEHLHDTLYGQLLPLISGELVPEAATGQPVPDTRVTLDFGANN